jgi:hypothetical protein
MKPVTNGDWDFISMIALVEGGNKYMIDQIGKSDESFKALETSRSTSVVGTSSSGNKGQDDAFYKIYHSKAAATYRKELSQKVAVAIFQGQGKF